MILNLEIPQGVNCSIKGLDVTVSGKMGQVLKKFKTKTLKLSTADGKIKIEGVDDRKKTKAEAYSVLKHLKNAFSGVQKKFVYKLTVVYSHFPMTLAMKGKEFHVTNFVGEKEVKIVKVPDNVEVVIKGKEISVKSVDKEAAGIIAGLMEKATVVKNRDRRIYQDGIYIVKKGVQDE